MAQDEGVNEVANVGVLHTAEWKAGKVQTASATEPRLFANLDTTQQSEIVSQPQTPCQQQSCTQIPTSTISAPTNYLVPAAAPYPILSQPSRTVPRTSNVRRRQRTTDNDDDDNNDGIAAKGAKWNEYQRNRTVLR